MNVGAASGHAGFGRTPVFDSAELDRMARAGLDRLYRFQHADGGWGWLEQDESTPYMTAYVLLGLNTAARSGVEVVQYAYVRGVQFLVESHAVANAEPAQPEKTATSHERAFVAYVLSLPRPWPAQDGDRDTTRQSAAALIDSVYRDRAGLNLYGRSLLALALHQRDEPDKAKEVLSEILQEVHTDRESGTAYVSTATTGWWHWWNGDIETNAWVLRAIVAIDGANELAPQMVEWLARHRQNGHHWRSTRDTALVVTAMTDYLRAVRDQMRECTVVVSLDSDPPEQVHVRWDDLGGVGNRLTIRPRELKPGRHVVRIGKQVEGLLSFAVSTRYLDNSERLAAEGHGIHLTRHYFRIATEPAATGSGVGQGPSVAQRELPSMQRVLLHSGDSVASGETIKVELHLDADADYEYLAFEDMKPAGCEPLQIQSGQTWGDGVYANVELRDEKTVFFVHSLAQGTHTLRYRLRAEVPGEFLVHPTRGFARYTPEIRARSDTMRLGIHDQAPENRQGSSIPSAGVPALAA